MESRPITCSLFVAPLAKGALPSDSFVSNCLRLAILADASRMCSLQRFAAVDTRQCRSFLWVVTVATRRWVLMDVFFATIQLLEFSTIVLKRLVHQRAQRLSWLCHMLMLSDGFKRTRLASFSCELCSALLSAEGLGFGVVPLMCGRAACLMDCAMDMHGCVDFASAVVAHEQVHAGWIDCPGRLLGPRRRRCPVPWRRLHWTLLRTDDHSDATLSSKLSRKKLGQLQRMARKWTKLGRIRTHGPEFQQLDQCWAKLGQPQPNLARHRSTSRRLRAKAADRHICPGIDPLRTKLN